MGGEKPTFSIRRGHILEDAFNNIMRSPLAYRTFRVEFFHDSGAKESGFGPGVLKEFLILALREFFTPSNGFFFVSSTTQQTVSPVTSSSSMHERAFTFMGALLARLVIYNVTSTTNTLFSTF